MKRKISFSNEGTSREIDSSICAVCGNKVSSIAFEPLKCCQRCQILVIEAEDDGGAWRSAYLSPAPRLVEASGQKMSALLGSLLPQSNPTVQLNGGLGSNDKYKNMKDALTLLSNAPRTLVLLGSGASASYNVPINLSVSDETIPLVRYAPVRHAALRAPSVGLYTDLKKLLDTLKSEICVVSTNIDGLAQREGLRELQLHGTTARLMCTPCQYIWDTPTSWPPGTCPKCDGPPLFNLPTDLLHHDDVVWYDIEKDRAEAIDFLKRAVGEPLGVLAIGTATHVHSLTPELRLIIETRAKYNDITNVVWVNLNTSHLDSLGYASGPLELLGDSKIIIEELTRIALSFEDCMSQSQSNSQSNCPNRLCESQSESESESKSKSEYENTASKLKLEGSDFQILVWKELLKIPKGETRTYKEIAIAIGKPNNSRAVANACGQNPYAPIVPCHRVLRSDGSLGGYSGQGGSERKQQLLDLESSSKLTVDS